MVKIGADVRLDGSTVHYLLTQEFGSIACDRSARRLMVDYPILYEDGADMAGHVVLVSKHARPCSGPHLEGSILVCVGGTSAAAARETGQPVIQVRGNVPFNRLCNYLQATFMRFERLDARLRSCVDSHGGAQVLLDECMRETGCPFALVDERYNRIYETALDEAAPGLLDDENIDLFMASHRYHNMRASRKVFVIPGSGELLMKNLFAGKRLRGTLISRHAGDPLSARYVRFVLGYLSGFLEETHTRIGSFGVDSEESDRVRAALSHLLSGGSENKREIEALLRESGHSPESLYVVLRIERSFTHEGAEDLEYLSRRFELSWPRAHSFAVEGALFMLADISIGQVSGEHDFLKDMLTVARDNLVKVGMSRAFTTMDSLDAAQMQAIAALVQGSAADPTFWVYRFDDYAFAWLVAHGRGEYPVEYVAHPVVAVLMRHDAACGTDLLHTLSVFVRCRYNATKAADELYVARSTLLNRLERIAELTGVDLDDADERLYVALSFAMLD